MVINKSDALLPGDTPLFISSNLPSHMYDFRDHNVCHVLLFILLISLQCAFIKSEAATVLSFWVFSINTDSVMTFKILNTSLPLPI